MIPLAVLLATVRGLTTAFDYLKTLYVSGSANEWVLIMKNGEMSRAGVGLTCFKGPFDQVAKFPSRVNKVEFNTQQVTKEMQGVSVSGIIVWSINRNGDGPYAAYKNLGNDLAHTVPKTANDNLVSMASAIVRSCIANSTIDEMLRNRKVVRDAIRKEMFEVVKGWGVWLETIEITDVKISSGSLFKDLQADFRESKRKEAEVQTMIIENEIYEFQTEVDKQNDIKEKDVTQKRAEFKRDNDYKFNEVKLDMQAKLEVIKQEKVQI